MGDLVGIVAIVECRQQLLEVLESFAFFNPLCGCLQLKV